MDITTRRVYARRPDGTITTVTLRIANPGAVTVERGPLDDDNAALIAAGWPDIAGVWDCVPPPFNPATQRCNWRPATATATAGWEVWLAADFARLRAAYVDAAMATIYADDTAMRDAGAAFDAACRAAVTLYPAP